MSKRQYTPRQISPEIARENALSAARAHVHNERKNVALCEGVLARYTEHGDEFGPATEAGIAARTRSVEAARADLGRCEAALAKLDA